MAAIGHTYAEQLTPQSTTSTSFVDVSGAVLSNTNLTAGKKYLIIVQGTTSWAGNSGDILLQVVHGSTAFASSNMRRDSPTAGTMAHYTWWTVWTAVSGEDVKLQIATASASEAATVDDVTMFAMNLSDDLTENTDWYFAENDTSTTLSSTYSTSNNASITFTPGTASHDWLVLTRSRLDIVTITISYQTRMEHSGGTTAPEYIIEPDDANEIFVLSTARVFNLAASTQTFNEEAAISGTGGGEARLNSGVFALDLHKFKEHTNAYTDGQVDLSATDFATEIATISITPSVASDVYIIGSARYNVAGSGQTIAEKRRIQLDNTSDLPVTQTYTYNDQNDARDRPPMQVCVMENLTAASHTLDFDASVGTAVAGRSAQHRQLAAWTMELASTTVQTTKTQTGVADVKKTTDRTQLGVAAIKRTTDRTQAGLADLKKTVDRTQLGVAAVKRTTDRTQGGLAAIQRTTDRTQNGVANIAAAGQQTTQTQLGVADIKRTTDRTQSGTADVKRTTDRTQSGTADIKKTTDRTQSGTADIKKTTDRTQNGVANIAVAGTTDRTQPGVAAIKKTTDRIQAGLARIALQTSKLQQGLSRIAVQTTRDQSGLAAIKRTTDRTQAGLARIALQTTRTQLGVALIAGAAVRNQTGIARIARQETRTQSGVAHLLIEGQAVQIQTGRARIAKTTTRTQPGRAWVAGFSTEAPHDVLGPFTWETILSHFRYWTTKRG